MRLVVVGAMMLVGLSSAVAQKKNGFSERSYATAVPGHTRKIRLSSDEFIPSGSPAQNLTRLLAKAGLGNPLHCILQFEHIPDTRQKQQLRRYGIRLLGYLPEYSYFALVQPNVDLRALDRFGITWVGGIQNGDKLSERLRLGLTGPWSALADGSINLTLRYFEGANLTELNQAIAGVGGVVIEHDLQSCRMLVNIFTTEIERLAGHDLVRFLDEGPPPRQASLDKTLSNTQGDTAQGVPYRLSGFGVVTALWDDGYVDLNHDDFAGRLVVGDSGGYHGSTHATHVAGIMAGTGLLSASNGGTPFQWRGMAPDADIVSYQWDNIVPEHQTAVNTHLAVVSQNSWNWVISSALGNCDQFGDYALEAPDYDHIITGSMYSNDPISIIFSVGNNRDKFSCRPAGVSVNEFYGSIAPPATGKNVLSVGAIRASDNTMTSFSGWGPTDDGRIKPELVAPGYGVYSTRPGDEYGSLSGTSMSTPAVSGAAALLIEDHRVRFGNQTPLPSTLRALMLHTAEDLNDGTAYYNQGPDFASGYGRLQVADAVDQLRAKGFLVGEVGHGETDTFSLAVPAGTTEVKVTLVWDDPAAVENAASTLVNNLDLVVFDGQAVPEQHFPWTLDPSNPATPATRDGLDAVNVIEQVYVDSLTIPTAETWTVSVEGLNVPVDAPQKYSLAFTPVGISVANNVPTIGSISNQTTDEDVGISGISISIGDSDPGDELTVSALPDDPTLLPKANITLTGSGNTRQLAVVPGPDAHGSTTVTVVVSDGKDYAETSFLLTVDSINDVPTQTAISNQTIPEDVTGSVSFTVDDDDTSAGSLIVTAASSNTTLIPNGNLQISGSGASKTLSFTPASDLSGSATITVTVDDTSLTSVQMFDVSVTAVNDPPTLSSLGNQTNDEETSTGQLGFTVDDVESSAGSLTLSGTSSNTGLVPHGNIGFGGSGSARTVEVAPVVNGTGSTTITVTISDGAASSSTSFVLTVNDINDTPTLSSIGNQSMTEDGSLTVNFTVGDVETSAGSLAVGASASDETLFPVGSLTLGGSGSNRSVTLNPGANLFGAATITVTVDDGQATVSEDFVVTVNSENDPPTLSSIGDLTIDEESSTGALSFTVDDVETEAGGLTVTAVSSNTGLVPNGNIVLGGSGSARTVEVSPPADEFGITTITLTVSDGAATSSDSFLLTVSDVNDLPTLSSLADQTMNEDGSLTFGITVGDLETPAGSLAVTASSNNETLFPGGSLTVGGSGSARTLSLNPGANEFGTATITVAVDDGQDTVSGSFGVTVSGENDPPTISDITDQSVAEDETLANVNFTIGDVEQAPEALVLSASSSNPLLVPAVNVVFGGSGSSRTLSLTPEADAFGTTTITVTVDDGETTASDSFELTVTSVNDPPIISSISDQTIDEETATGSLSFTVGDVETSAGSLTVSGVSSNTGLVPNSNIVFGGVGSDRTVEVTPIPDGFGATTVTVSVSDGDASSSTSFLLTVTGINDPPTVSDVSDQTMSEDGSLTVQLTVGDLETAVGSLAVTASSNNETLFPSGGLTVGGSGSNRTLSLNPVADEFGSATITVTVDDGSATASDSFVVSVISENDPPAISDIANHAIPEDGATGALSFTVSDVETSAASLKVTGVSSNIGLVPDENIVLGGSGSSRTVELTPISDAFGTTTITLTVSDSDATASASFLLTVNAVNDLPTLTNTGNQTVSEDGSLTLNVTLDDVETAVGSLVLTAASSNETLFPVGSLVLGGSESSRTLGLNPAANEFGSATITVTVNDGEASVSDTFEVTVSGENDPPTISDIANQAISENSSTGALSFTVSDVETSAASLSMSGASSNTGLVPNGNIVFGGSGSSRTVEITPTADAFGTTTITLTVSDGGGSASMSFLVSVNEINDPPSLTDIANQTMNEDGSLTLNVTVGDLETPVEGLVVTASSNNQTLFPNGGLTVGGSGSDRTLSLNPVAHEYGSATITVTVDDGFTTTSDSFEVTVSSENDLPTLTDTGNQTMSEDGSLTLNVTVDDVETAVGSLVLTAASSNETLFPVGSLVLGGGGSNRTLGLNPAANEFGSATITVTVNDGEASVSDTFEVTVSGENDPPTISDIANLSILESTSTGSIGFSVGDIETSAALLVLSANSSDDGLLPIANIVFDGSGAARTVNLTPVSGQTGTVTITINVGDGAAIASDTFELVVTPENTAPTISGIADQTVAEDGVLTGLSFSIGDLETATDSLEVTGGSSNPSLLPLANLVFGGDGANRTLSATPESDAFGASTITVTVTDGTASVSEAFVLTVTAENDVPTIESIADRTIEEGSTTGVLSFTVADVEISPSSLTVSGESSHSDLVPNGNIVIGGSGSSRTVEITPAPGTFGAATITLTVSDGTASSSTSFLLTVNEVIEPPSISSISDQTILEDGSLGGIGFLVGDPDTDLDSLSLSGSSSDTGLILDDAIVFSGTGANRSLTVTPESDQFGSALITVVVSDGSASAETTFLVTVEPVNDAPLFTKGSDLSVANTGSPFLFSNWATGIAAGPANENSQGLQFILSAADPSFFTVPPALDPDGSLSFTLVPEASGSMVLSVRLTDDGGTENGGIDTSVTEEVVLAFGSYFFKTLEAEEAEISGPLEIHDSDDNYGGYHVKTITTNSGRMTFTVDIPSDGQYILWGRVIGFSSSHDSYTVSTDSESTDVYDIAEGLWSQAWQWTAVNGRDGTGVPLTLNPRVFTFTAGTHEIYFDAREKSSKLDCIIICSDLNFVASGAPPRISAIQDRTTFQGEPTEPVLIEIGDDDTAVEDMVLSGYSSEPVGIPSENIQFSFDGTTWSTTVIPSESFTGTATVTVRVNDGVGEVESSFLVTVNPQADLELMVSSAPAQIIEGYSLTYRFSAHNYGPGAALDVALTDELPDGAEFISGEITQGSFSLSSGVFTAELGAIASGGQAEIALVVSLPAGFRGTSSYSIDNLASISSSVHDGDLLNNTASVVTAVQVDQDGDGMSDDFEDAAGLNKVSAEDGELDEDGDGYSNAQEFVAGTDLFTSSDAPGITDTMQSGNDIHIQFHTIPNRWYQLQRIHDYGSGNWEDVGDPVQGDGNMIQFIDTDAANLSQCFYRVSVLLGK